MMNNLKSGTFLQAAKDIIDNGHAIVRLSDLESDKLHRAIGYAVEFFQRPPDDKLAHGSRCYNYGYRPFGIEYSMKPEHPDMNECFTVWSDRLDLIPNPKDISELTASFLDWRNALVPLVGGIIVEIAKSFGAETAPAFQKASYLQINHSLPTPLEQKMLQDKHEDGNIVTVIHANAPGLEIYTEGGGSEVVLPMLPARNEVIIMPGSVLTALSGGAVVPLYHHVRNHGLDNRQSLMYFVNPEIDEPLYGWVKPGEGELTDIREYVQNAPLMFGLPPIEVL